MNPELCYFFRVYKYHVASDEAKRQDYTDEIWAKRRTKALLVSRSSHLDSIYESKEVAFAAERTFVWEIPFRPYHGPYLFSLAFWLWYADGIALTVTSYFAYVG